MLKINEELKINENREYSSHGQTKHRWSVTCTLGELSVHSLLRVSFAHAYSFFLNGPRSQTQRSRMWKRPIFSALDCSTHSWTNVWVSFKEMRPRQAFSFYVDQCDRSPFTSFWAKPSAMFHPCLKVWRALWVPSTPLHDTPSHSTPKHTTPNRCANPDLLSAHPHWLSL